jgi:hypothetical protein
MDSSVSGLAAKATTLDPRHPMRAAPSYAERAKPRQRVGIWMACLFLPLPM